jgi:hypothetical protein
MPVARRRESSWTANWAAEALACTLGISLCSGSGALLAQPSAAIASNAAAATADLNAGYGCIDSPV